MSRRGLAVAAGVLLLAAAVALALLGRAALAVPSSVDRASPVWPGSAERVQRDRSLPDRVAASLLDAGRSDTFEQAVAIYQRAVADLSTAGDPRGPVAIAKLIPRLRSPVERAQALTMAGTLLAYSAGAGFGVVLPGKLQASTENVLAEARRDFKEAVQADPGNEAAKFDLELLLRQQQLQSPPSTKRKRRPTPTTQDTRRKSPAGNGQEHHAGIYETGSGY